MITGVDMKNANSCRGLVNAILDTFEENLGYDVSTILLYYKNYFLLRQEVKNETITSIYQEIQRMYFSQSLVEKTMDVVMI